MAELTHAYAESTGRSTTTSTTVGGANKVRLTHTPGDNETWLYLWDALVDSSVTTADVVARFRNETASADWANINMEPQDTTDRLSVGGLKVHTYGASPGSQDIDIDFWMESAGTAGCGDAHIFGLKIDSDYKHVENDAEDTNASSPTADKTTATMTETLSGDYLFLFSCEYQTDSTANIRIRADIGGTKYGEMNSAGALQDTTTWRTWATGVRLTGLSGSVTALIEFFNGTGGVTVSVRKRRIIAIPLSKFNKVGYDEDRTRDTNTISTPEVQSSLAFTPDATRNHIAIAGMILDHNSNASSGLARWQRDSVSLAANNTEEPNVGGADWAWFSLRRESLTGGVSTTYTTDKWTEGATVGCAESWIIVLDLEAAAAAGPGPVLNANPFPLLGVGRKLP